jgi:AcrR family transcriptional regulator
MSTLDKILGSAESLFEHQGFEATTLRQITAAAGVNLAAVNYHFGSKEALIREIFRRRLTQLNQERLAALDRLEKAALGRPVKPAKILDAFFGTLLRIAQNDKQGGPTFLKLLGRTLTEPSEFIRIFLAAEYEEVLNRYKEALIKSLPDVPREEILWRFHFMLGATAYAIAGTDSLQLLAHEGASESNEPPTQSRVKDAGTNQVKKTELMEIDRLLPRLMNFLVGGLRAPLPDFETNTPQLAQVRQAALRIPSSNQTPRTPRSAIKGKG